MVYIWYIVTNDFGFVFLVRSRMFVLGKVCMYLSR